MEIVYLRGSCDQAMYQRIKDGEVEPHCMMCKAKLNVYRISGEPTGLIHAMRCPTNPNHFMTTYRIAIPEIDAIVRRRSLEPDDE
jgi:hypothetical protein